MQKRIIITGFLLFIGVSLFAGTADFLNFPVSVRGSGIGQSVVALDKEISAVMMNPAGISGIDGFGISLVYNKALFGNNNGNVTIVHPAGIGMLGISFTFSSFGIENSFLYGENKGSRNLTDINLGMAFQRNISDSFSIGIGAKFISIDLGDVKGSTAGADLGILYMISPKSESGRLNIGVALRNAGLSLKFKNESEKLPMMASSGIMYKPVNFLNFTGELDYIIMNSLMEYGFGIEIIPVSLLQFRGGYKIIDGGNFLTAGLGINKELGSMKLNIDYGMNLNSEISTEHYISTSILFPALFEIRGRKEKIPYDGKNPTRIAVSEFEVRNCEEELGASVAEWLRSDLAKSEFLTLIAREEMTKILQEQEIQLTGITTSEDAVVIGKILNVKIMILGSLSKVGSEYYISVKAVDVETGKVEATAEEVATSKGVLRIAVKKLALKLDPKEE